MLDLFQFEDLRSVRFPSVLLVEFALGEFCRDPEPAYIALFLSLRLG